MRILKFSGILLPALVLLLLVAAHDARATILRMVPLEDQARDAELVVVAVAGQKNCVWGDGQKLIFTDIDFKVERWVKGSGGESVVARRIGGVIGDIGQTVAGSPQFRTGGRYVLFLEPTEGGRYRVVGFSQGAYPVVKSFWGGSKVMPSLAAEGGAGVEMIGAPGGSAGPQPLEEFLSRVKSILGEGGGLDAK